MLLGAAMAIGQRDLKKILAYSTVSVLGTLTMLLGAGTEVAIKAAVVFLVAHALYKAALFLVAGSIDHETGTRDLEGLGGLRAAMPFTAAAGVLAALSKAGAPPMFGFVGKELLYKAKLDLESIAAWLVVAAVIANVALVATALAVGVRPFFGPVRPTPRPAHETPWSMRLGPLVLAGLGLFVGTVPGVFDRTLGSAMAGAIAGRPVTMVLELWYGVSPSALLVLALSVATLGLGWMLFHRLTLGRGVVAWGTARLAPFGPAAAYGRLVDGLPRFAAEAIRPLQSGHLRRYVGVVLLVAVAASAPWLGSVAVTLAGRDATPPGALDALLGVLALAGAAMAVRTRSRLAAVAALGVTGVAVAGLFALHGALDVAATQLAVEALTVVLFVLLFRGIPRTRVHRRMAGRAVTAGIALAGGVLLGALTWAATAVRRAPDAAAYFSAAAAPEGYGRNVVNVILVDFRALDTLGEIVVVAAAGLGILVLARVRAALRRTPS
jgi:multicomponent Na+:H+ antiporter subunit A